ncbi:hypothetical protein XA68_16256 [Ophiocordyceps unilateralis]|uniref:Uncharacterized protein n=1 Tax=Ophiocordyceps unilateralis TaxID=268505 RepID=A0A2A9P6P8_OPHUN|nr:hypothetical protein XA68_16256 [Ophiocordyceps unilateralis]
MNLDALRLEGQASLLQEYHSTTGSIRPIRAVKLASPIPPCQPGGKLSGHEPLSFDTAHFAGLRRLPVCAQPLWEAGRCSFFNSYAFTAEQYGPICRACFPVEART